MATYFVASGGSNTSPYDTWAKAATSLATALGAATAVGDVVVIQYNGVPSTDAEVGADTTYNIYNGIAIISASNDGGSAYTPTVMGTANWIGNSTTNRSINLNFGSLRSKIFVYGLTLRTSGSTADSIVINSNSSGPNGPVVFEECYFWEGNTNSSGVIAARGPAAEVRFLKCTFRFGATGQGLQLDAKTELIECTLSSSGSTPTNLLSSPVTYGAGALFSACDLSLVTNTLVPAVSNSYRAIFDRCKLGSGVVVLAAQSTLLGLSEVWVLDCHSGDTHMEFGYYNGLGSLTKDSAIYFTSGAAAASWKLVTTSYASRFAPFVTPWVDFYNTGTSAITPYFEILRDGSTTAYKDHEIWAEFTAKTVSGFTTATFHGDRASVANYLSAGGSDQAAGAGLGSWTGESGTAWSGKIDSGSSFTPAEVGYLRGRMVFGVASATIYMDPEIRT